MLDRPTGEGLSGHSLMFVLAINICGVWEGLIPSSGVCDGDPHGHWENTSSMKYKTQPQVHVWVGKCVDGSKTLNLLGFEDLSKDRRAQAENRWVGCVFSQIPDVEVLGELRRRTK